MSSRAAVLTLVALVSIALVLVSPRDAGRPSAVAGASAGAAEAALADVAGEAQPPQGVVEEPLPVPEGPGIAILVTRESVFAWPALGLLTSYFGPGHPTGIDISLAWDSESPIFASSAGRVSFAGGDACCSYGYHVVIDHAGGFSTLYAHLSEVLVKEGDGVQQGDVLGLGGNTGASEGKHLHFEVLQDGVMVDPLRFLPGGQEARYGPRTEPMDCQDRALRVDAGSLVRVEFRPNGESGRLESVTLSPTNASSTYPAPEVETEEPLGVSVRFRPASAATGQTVRFQLDATIRRAEGVETFACWLDLKTMPTLKNSDATIARYRSRSAGASPSPRPTATATMWRLSPTPPPPPPSIRTPPAPLTAPGAAPTATPRAPQPLKVPTRADGPR